MKIIVTESQLKTLNELGGQIKDETEIIYRDRNIVCLVPKTQMASKIYGKGTHWCSISRSGFELWAKQGLLVRFIFRGGKKIRFTYLFNGEFNWANENGYHTLLGHGNPFDVKDTGSNYSNEKDILKHIQLIPEKCKEDVLNFIKRNKKEYDYCFREKEYKTKRELILDKLRDNVFKVWEKYRKKTVKVFDNDKFYIRPIIDDKNLKMCITYSYNYESFSDKNEYETECFDDIRLLDKRYNELLIQSKTKRPPAEGSTSGLES